MPARKPAKRKPSQSSPDPRIRVNNLSSNLTLSIRQPHAEDIMTGFKKIEYRSFPTYIRGPVYIYASKVPDEELDEPLPLGMVIGSVEIVHCTGSDNDYQWHLKNPKRLKKPLKPTGRPQPSFWYAWDKVE